MNDEPVKILRLGDKKNFESTSRHRPMKVIMPTEESKVKAVRNNTKIRQADPESVPFNPNRVYISLDQTRLQRENEIELINKLKIVKQSHPNAKIKKGKIINPDNTSGQDDDIIIVNDDNNFPKLPTQNVNTPKTTNREAPDPDKTPTNENAATQNAPPQPQPVLSPKPPRVSPRRTKARQIIDLSGDAGTSKEPDKLETDPSESSSDSESDTESEYTDAERETQKNRVLPCRT